MANDSPSKLWWIAAWAVGIVAFAFVLAVIIVRHPRNESSSLSVETAFHPIDGDWMLKSIVADGKHSPGEMKKLQTWSIHDNILYIAGRQEGPIEAIILFPYPNLNAIDIHISTLQSRPLILYGLYEHTDKSLRICYSQSEESRPTDMRDPVPEESGNVLYTFTK